MLSLLKIESFICQTEVQDMFLATRVYARNKSLSCKQVHFCKNTALGKNLSYLLPSSSRLQLCNQRSWFS